MNHAGKFFFGLSLLMTMFALPCFADTWQSRHITTLYSGVYEGRERLIFRTDNSEMRYLDLTGTEASRNAAAILLSALYKGNLVDINVTSKYINAAAGSSNFWYEVTLVGVRNIQ